MTPIYYFGRGQIKTPVFTCPVSALPDWMWDLFDAFIQSRLMRLPVVAGGLLAQPLIVRRAFPIWEQEMATSERELDASASMAANTSLLTTLLTMRGGR